MKSSNILKYNTFGDKTGLIICPVGAFFANKPMKEVSLSHLCGLYFILENKYAKYIC
jgi:hypothetical protein